MAAPGDVIRRDDEALLTSWAGWREACSITNETWCPEEVIAIRWQAVRGRLRAAATEELLRNLPP